MGVGKVPGVGASVKAAKKRPARKPSPKPHGVGAVPGVGAAVKRRVQGLNRQGKRYGLKPINARKVASGSKAEQRRVKYTQRGVNIRRDRARGDRAARRAARKAGPPSPPPPVQNIPLAGRTAAKAQHVQPRKIHAAEARLHTSGGSQAKKESARKYLRSQGVIPTPTPKPPKGNVYKGIAKVNHDTISLDTSSPGDWVKFATQGLGSPVSMDDAVEAIRPVVERLTPNDQIGRLTSPTAGGTEPVKDLIKGAVGAASGDFLQSKGQKKLQQAGIAPTALPRADASKVVSKTVEKGALAAGGAVFEGFDRTAGAGVSLASKTAVEAGLIHDPKLVKKIKAAPGPDDVILHGRNKKNPLTGGDLTQGLGLGRTQGILAELALDPTTYIGISALPETGGASGGLLAAKLAKLGIGVKKAATAVKAATGGERTAKNIKEVLAARDAFDAEHGRNFTRLKETKAGEVVPKGRGHSLHVPGPEGQAAVQHVLQHVNEGRTRPGFRIHVGNPLRPQFSKLHVNVPLGPLGKLPIIPTTSAVRRRNAVLAFARSRGSERIKREAQIEAVNKDITAAQHAGDHAAVEALTGQKQSILKESLARSAELRSAGSLEARTGRLRSIQDVVDAHNVKRATIETGKVADEFGRLVNEKFMANVQKAIKPLSHGPIGGRAAREHISLVRIGQYLRARADTAGAVLPHDLTPREHFVVGQLDRVYKAMEHQAVKSGVMSRGLSDYGGPLHWRFETTEGGKAPDAVSIVDGMAGSLRTTSPRFTKHRLYPSAAEIADPHALAESIQNVSNPPRSFDEALQVANDWHAHGNIRLRQELIARQLQRGHVIHYENLSPEDYKAVQYGAATKKDGEQQLFDLDQEHQIVKLSDAGKRHFGFDPGEFQGLDDASSQVQRLYSAMKDREHLDSVVVRQARNPNAQAEWGPRAEQLDAEIAALDQPMHGLPVETKKAARQIIKQQTGGRAQLPKGLTTHTFLNEHGIAMIGDGKNPLPGALSDVRPRRTPDEVAADEDPFDWSARLPDIRRLESGTLPEFDPRVAHFYRTRAQGWASAEHAWYRAIDQEHGRSASEADKQFVTPDGQNHAASDFTVDKDTNGDIIGYEDVVNGKYYDVQEVHIQPATLVPTGRGSEYLDPVTNQAYRQPVLAHTKDLPPGVEPDRVWPLQTIDFVNLRNAGGKVGGTESAYDRLYQSYLASGWQRVLGYMRFGVTTPFPAYHIRNLISDSIKSLQADTGVIFHPIVNAKLAMAAYGKGLARTIRVPGYGPMKIEDFLLLADTYPVRSGHHIAEVYRLIDTGKFTESEARRFLGQLGPGGFLTKLGGEREDIVRFQTFMQAMRRTDGDAAESMLYMIRHHFNYNDLSAREKRLARNLFLFYTWYRKNIPLQFAELIRRPGFFAGIVHTYDALEAGETPIQQDYSGIKVAGIQLPDLSGPVPKQPALPEYVFNKLLSVPLSWNGHAINIGFGLPQADIQLVSSGGAGDVLQLTNPFISTTYSLLSGKDVLTGRTYKEQEPSGIANVLDTVLQETGIDPDGLPRPDGKHPVLPWWLNVTLRNLPILGRGAGTLGPSSPARDSGPNFELLRELQPLTGLNIYPSPAPGSAHEKRAITSLVSGRIAQYNEDQKNLAKDITPKNKKKWVLDQKDQLRDWAREQGIPLGYLRRAKASPFHPNQSSRRKPNPGLPTASPNTTSKPENLTGGGGLP